MEKSAFDSEAKKLSIARVDIALLLNVKSYVSTWWWIFIKVDIFG